MVCYEGVRSVVKVTRVVNEHIFIVEYSPRYKDDAIDVVMGWVGDGTCPFDKRDAVVVSAKIVKRSGECSVDEVVF